MAIPPIMRCHLCKDMLGAHVQRVWMWQFHPQCAFIVHQRLLRFEHILLSPEDEFQTSLADSGHTPGVSMTSAENRR